MSVQLVYLAHSSVIGKHSFNDNGSGMCIKHMQRVCEID